MNGAKDKTLFDMKKFLEFKNQLEASDEQTINEGFRNISEKYQSIGLQNTNCVKYLIALHCFQ